MKNELLNLKAVEAVQRASQDSFDGLDYYLGHFVYTLDEHDKEHPIKKLPYHKDYMKEVAQNFLTEQLLLIEKSRQMMITWLLVACCLWDVQFHQGRRVFFQSKKEEDANSLVDRAKIIYENYPQPVKSVINELYPATNTSYLTLEFEKYHSIIKGIPQGAAKIRMHTASRIFSDEMAFQEEAEEAYIAAKPTLVGGGQYLAVSTPNFKNFFYRVAKDKLGPVE